ncbi:thiolase family protein [uncultured Roseovarius sp.]|uniref:thiolase family protein n=1 Tax=uncultured Roseovarius sp. TaxID=293344 RepID=UPI0026370DDD|nr:thiolase family protein [uncultured Roseovarius sp.]
MTRSFIIAARRSAVAPRNGRLADLSLHDLAAPVVTQALHDASLAKSQVDEIIVSNALGAGGNPARVVALAAELPQTVAGLSVDRQCVGGLDALLIADAMIKSGQHDIVIAGGVESYSRRPLRYRTFADGSDPQPYEQAAFTPWADRDPDMATAAHRLSEMLHIDQAKQDEWAIDSHRKAIATAPEIKAAEIVKISGLNTDTFTRNLTPRHCSKAKTVHGSVTSANMAVAADAAAFAIIVSEKIARHVTAPKVELLAGQTLGGDPACPGLAPVTAIEKVLAQTGMTPENLITAEIMEAFAIQAIACQQGVRIPRQIVNPHGGSLARGHPIGASGAILAVSLYHQLCRNPGCGLVAIAAAGGLGSALLARKL